MASPLVIELIGPSGSGKTTFMRNTIRNNSQFESIEMAAFRGLLHHPVIKVPGAFVLKLLPVRFAHRLGLTKIVSLYRDQLLVHHGKAYTQLLGLCYRTINNLTISEEEKFWLSRRIADTVTNHALLMQPVNADKTILADEFFLQKIWRLTDNVSDAKKYIANVPPPAILLLFEIDNETSYMRVRGRKDGKNIHAQNMSDAELRERITSTSTVMQLLANDLEQICTRKFVRVQPMDIKNLAQLLLRTLTT